MGTGRKKRGGGGAEPFYYLGLNDPGDSHVKEAGVLVGKLN